jgi:hypothetical protein
VPRNPFGGGFSGVFGLLWGALGLVLAAWAMTTVLDTAKGFDLASWALANSPVDLPWDPVEGANFAINHVGAAVGIAVVALLLAWSNLRVARIAFRPATESHDGRGELQLAANAQPRVGKAFEGTIRLRDPPAPGEEFDVALVGGNAGAKPLHRIEQRVRARQGAQGVHLPFRLEVPASARASGLGYPWRLEFARPGKRAFGRSRIEVKLGPAPEHEARGAHAVLGEEFAPAHDGATPALEPDAPQAQALAQGYVARIERLYGALGGRLTAAQREQLRSKLSAPEAAAIKRQLDSVRQLSPQHLKVLKYVVIGLFVLFFVLPIVFSVLGVVLAALFGS